MCCKYYRPSPVRTPQSSTSNFQRFFTSSLMFTGINLEYSNDKIIANLAQFKICILAFIEHKNWKQLNLKTILAKFENFGPSILLHHNISPNIVYKVKEFCAEFDSFILKFSHFTIFQIIILPFSSRFFRFSMLNNLRRSNSEFPWRPKIVIVRN